MSREQKKMEPVPDGPQLRSVLIRSPPSLGIPPPRALNESSSPKLVKTASRVTPNNGPWKLSNAELRPLPEMYPLERTHVYIEHAQVQEVASSIAECLRNESIAAVFDKTMVLGETPQHVRLCIRLFQDEEQLVVEVQRRSGCCYFFHQASKSILRAAKGMKAQQPTPLSVPDSVLAEADLQDATEEAVDLANGLLRKDRLDAQLLGMESLVHITKTSTKAALVIMSGHVVLDTILSLVIQDNEEPTHESEQDYVTMMHRNALTVLANCLASLEQSGDLTQVLASESRLVEDKLLQVLIRELDSAQERPHDACQACKCLQSLLRVSSVTKSRAVALGVPQAATEAFNEGVCSHLHLEQEARTLQVEIGL